MGWTDYNVLIRIEKKLPQNFKCFHVKDHQGIKVNPELDPGDNLNIPKDMRAKRAQTKIQADFSVIMNNERITGSFVKEMRRILSQNQKRRKSGRVITKMIHHPLQHNNLCKNVDSALILSINFITMMRKLYPIYLSSSFAKKIK
jgi:hypothetical protein